MSADTACILPSPKDLYGEFINFRGHLHSSLSAVHLPQSPRGLPRGAYRIQISWCPHWHLHPLTKTLSAFSLAFWSRERAEERKELPVKEPRITKPSPATKMEWPNVVASWPFPNSESSTLCTTFAHHYSPSPAFVIHSILLLFQESDYWWLFLRSFPWQSGENRTEDSKCAGPLPWLS